MSSNLIRPTNAVQIPEGQQNIPQGVYPQYGQPQYTQQQQANPTAILGSFLSNGSTGSASTGGIDWSRYDNGVGDDPALRELSIGNVEEEKYNQNQYLARIMPHIGQLIESVAQRRGPMYECFRESIEGFKADTENYAQSNCRARFVDFINKHPEQHFPIAKNVGVFLTKLMLDKMRQTGNPAMPAREILGMVELGVRNVLFFEIIGWMTKTREGRQFSYEMDKTLERSIQVLPQLKEKAAMAWNELGMTFPYNETEFRREAPVAQYGLNLGSPLPGFYDFNDPSGKTTRMDNHARDQAIDYINRRVERNKDQYREHYTPTYNEPNKMADTGVFNPKRYDIDNLTFENRSEFDLEYFFNPVPGHEHTYLVADADWKKLKLCYPKSPFQGPEISVFDPYHNRVVYIDFEGDQRWRSDMFITKQNAGDVMLNPSLILPALEAKENGEVVVVNTRKAKDVVDEETKVIPRAVIAELEEEITVIAYEDKLVGQDSMALESESVNLNKHLTANIRNVNATALSMEAEEVVNCSSPAIKRLAEEHLGFMFEGSEELNGMSFYMAIKELLNAFRSYNFGSELPTYINNRMTKFFNEYLVNEGGYNPDSNAEGHLSVSSILDDIDEIMEILAKREPKIHDALSIGHRDCSLKWKLKMFRDDSKTDDSDLSLADIASRELQLTVYRPSTVVMVNRDTGIRHTPNEVVTLKRSVTPLYFELMEKGWNELHGDMLEFDNCDKILQFSQDNSRWLFSRSVFDHNIAFLRHATRRGKMSSMIFD